MKAIKLHGKDYYPVAERLKEFREKHPNHSITTEIIECTEDSVIMRGVIKDESGRVIADGIAQKRRDWGGVNTRHMVEFCQTAANGRALAYFGIGVTDEIASADEMSDVDSSGDASYSQVSMIEELLKTANIPEKHLKAIDAELVGMTKNRAGKCLEYLRENQPDSLDKQFKNKIK